jgi:hypothetical protein
MLRFLQVPPRHLLRQLESLLKCGAVECDSDEVEEILDAVEFDESGYIDVGGEWWGMLGIFSVGKGDRVMSRGVQELSGR